MSLAPRGCRLGGRETLKSWIVVCIVWVVGIKSNTKKAQLGKKLNKASKQTNKKINLTKYLFFRELLVIVFPFNQLIGKLR